MKRSFEVPLPAIEKDTKAVKELGNEIERTGQKAKSAQSKGFRLGGVERRTSQVGAALRGLGAGELGGGVQAVGDVLQLAESLSELPQQLGVVTAGASKLGIVLTGAAGGAALLAAGVAAIKFKEVYDQVQAGNKQVASAITGLETYYDAIQKGTTDTIQAQIDKLKEDQKVAQQLLNDAKAAKARGVALKEDGTVFEKFLSDVGVVVTEATGGFKALDESISTNEQSVASLQAKIDALTRAAQSAEVATNDWVEEMKGFIAEATAFDEAQAALRKSIHDTTVAQQELNRESFAKQLEKEREKESKMVDVLQKRDAAIMDIEEKSAQARIDLDERTTETIAKIIDNAIEANEKSFVRLKEAQSKLLADSDNAELEADRRAAVEDLQFQIDENRKERDELEGHLKKVRDIQRSFRAQERDAVYDRNFDQLFRLQESKADQLSEEDQAYADQKKARQQSIRDEREDTARQRSFERSERRIALQIALNEAHAGYVKELELNRQAKETSIRMAQQAAVTELQIINQSEITGIELKRQGAIRELELINQTEAAKQAIFIRYLNEARSLLGMSTTPTANTYQGNQTFTSLDTRGQRITRFADGGYARANQWIEVDEPGSSGRESFSGAMFPGHGFFMPAHGGNVDPGGDTSNNNTFNFNINAIDPKGTAREVEAILKRFYR
jgi:hypothetical protein